MSNQKFDQFHYDVGQFIGLRAHVKGGDILDEKNIDFCTSMFRRAFGREGYEGFNAKKIKEHASESMEWAKNTNLKPIEFRVVVNQMYNCIEDSIRVYNSEVTRES